MTDEKAGEIIALLQSQNELLVEILWACGGPHAANARKFEAQCVQVCQVAQEQPSKLTVVR